MKIIKQLRDLLDISQAELAEKAEISRGHLSEIENGRKNPSLKTLAKIANTFNLRPSQFEWIKENSKTTFEVAQNYLKIKEATD